MPTVFLCYGVGICTPHHGFKYNCSNIECGYLKKYTRAIAQITYRQLPNCTYLNIVYSNTYIKIKHEIRRYSTYFKNVTKIHSCPMNRKRSGFIEFELYAAVIFCRIIMFYRQKLCIFIVQPSTFIDDIVSKKPREKNS